MAGCLATVGECLWTGAYVAAFWTGWKSRTYAIPLPAILLNVTWEGLFTFWRPSARGGARILYFSWFVLDLGILGEALAWGGPPQCIPLVGRYFYLLVVLGLLGSAATHAVIYQRFRNPKVEAFALNAVMSALFLGFLVTRPDGRGLSGTVAWLKGFGTAAISTANFVGALPGSGPRRGFLILVVGIGLLDAGYLYLLYAH